MRYDDYLHEEPRHAPPDVEKTLTDWASAKEVWNIFRHARLADESRIVSSLAFERGISRQAIYQILDRVARQIARERGGEA